MSKPNTEKRVRRSYGSKDGESNRCRRCWGLIHDKVGDSGQRKCRNCGEISQSPI